MNLLNIDFKMIEELLLHYIFAP